MRISDWSSDVCSSDLNIRITPSKLGDIPLSEKSIPFYYKVAEGTDRLFQYWDHNKTINERADQNLSYRADEYNGGDEHIRRSEERSVGKEGVSTCRSWWCGVHEKRKTV